MSKILDKIEEYICIICLVAMTILVFANVFSRYALHASLSFSDEITTKLFILLSMLGTAIAAKPARPSPPSAARIWDCRSSRTP